MAITTPQRRRQQLLIGILAIVLLIIVSVVWFGFLRDTTPPPPPPPATAGSSIPRVTIPSELFFDASFLDLSPYTPISLPPKIGKDNPFNTSSQ